MNTPKTITLLLGLIIATLWTTGVSAQSVPSLINYQGKLTDASGNPLPNGTYGVAFRIWSKKSMNESGDQLIWGQEYNVAVQNGVFNIILGASGGVAITNAAVNDLRFAFTDPERYFGATVIRGANGIPILNAAEILPRQQLLSAPFACVANVAGTAAIATHALNGVPPGTVLPFAGATIPSGFLLCDGSQLNRNTYSNLFSALGVLYGSGNGSSTFNLPDCRGRGPIGAGTGIGLSSRSLGDILGEENHTLAIAEMPSHTHSFQLAQSDNGFGGGVGTDDFAGFRDTSSTGGGQPHNNMQPSIVLNFIIKY